MDAKRGVLHDTLLSAALVALVALLGILTWAFVVWHFELPKALLPTPGQCLKAAMVEREALLTGILSIVIRKAGRTSMLCASLAELFKSRLPIVGRIHQVGREGRFLRQLGTLLRGGVALPSALQNMAGSCPSAWERAELEQFRQRLLMGAPVAEGLANCRLLKPATCMLLVAGQEAGRLDQYLIRLAEEDEALAAWRLQQAVRLLEPALLLGLSAAVGGLVLAYLLPMVRLLEQLA